MAKLDLKIFRTGKLKFTDMYNDVMDYIKSVYNTNGREFTMASPFAQIVNVILHLGRMILFYIESSITELNIDTAYQARSIKGLATLTGHIPSRGIAARGTLYMSYNNNASYKGEIISIDNYCKVKNTSNGLPYIMILPSKTMQLTVGAYDSKLEIPVIQGEMKYQKGTGTGLPLQSINLAAKGDDIIDDFFINVYVNGKRWENVQSILDMTFDQHACIVKGSLNGGIDVFFGTGLNGCVPEQGASIICEYLVTSGNAGNIYSESDNNYWTFTDDAVDVNGDYVNLNDCYILTAGSEMLFGSNGETIEMTRMLAPNMSRNFVLANETNYKTFLSKLNIFSYIHVFSGFNTYEDNKAETDYENAKLNYNSLKESYVAQVNLTGKESSKATALLEDLISARKVMDACKVKYDEARMDDNTIYMYLIPDVTKRIDSNENYFTCSKDDFILTDDEKSGILDLIDNCGQKMLTVDNKIVDPIFVKFAMNIFVQIWNNYDFNSVKSDIISKVSDYLLKNERKDRIPVSDIIAVVEAVDGVDSVNMYFDADRENELYYGEGSYGIDEYGDIVLDRVIQDRLGNNLQTQDLHPLFRGPFTSYNGVEYSDTIGSVAGPINITLRGKTLKK